MLRNPDTFVGALRHCFRKLVLVMILVLTAILSIPMSNAVNAMGLKRAFYRGMIVMLLCMVSILTASTMPVVVILTVVFAVVYTVISVCTLPLAIELSDYNEKVFCVGIFFSGVALPDAIIQTFMII